MRPRTGTGTRERGAVTRRLPRRLTRRGRLSARAVGTPHSRSHTHRRARAGHAARSRGCVPALLVLACMLFLYACVDACVDTNLCWSACLLACVHASLLACLLACLLASLHGFMHKSCVQARRRLAHSHRAHCIASQVGYASCLSLIQSYNSSESSPHRSGTRPPCHSSSHITHPSHRLTGRVRVLPVTHPVI